MKILATAGDIGGARAIMPVLDYLFNASVPFEIVNHNYLGKHAPDNWQRVSPLLEGRVDSLESRFRRNEYGALIFTTSVQDTVALNISRLASLYNIFTIHLLDNWTNYMLRLTNDGLPSIYPEVYAVMDDYALKAATDDGIPKNILKITGQPALSSLEDEFLDWSNTNKSEKRVSIGFHKKKKLLIFVSEPVEADQGGGSESPQFRGYTEKMVLQQLCHYLQPYSDEIQLGLLPHPRENDNELQKEWEMYRGNLVGGIVMANTGREAVFMADGVSGMASILLYEAWLINKPVISLQPGIKQLYLWIMNERQGCYFLSESGQWEVKVREWLTDVHKAPKESKVKHDINIHKNAPEKIAKILINSLGNC